MMATDRLDTVEDPELKAHFLAYFKLVQSVLSKKSGTPEQKKQVYQKLQSYLLESAGSIDDFIDHIPDMARMLAVPAQSLSGFIAQNFLRALEMSREELKESTTAGGSAAQGAADPERDHDLIGELLELIGPVVQAPNKFVPADMGLIKLQGPSGEKLPVSLSGNMTGNGSSVEVAAAGDAGNDAGADSASAQPAPVATQAATNVKGKSVPVAAREEPLIQEILNRFGNHLDVHEKLEPAVFPANFNPGSSTETATPVAPTEQGSDRSAGGVKTNAVPKPAAPAIEYPDESVYLIAEILENFGNDLSVHGKLEPSDGLPGRGARTAADNSASVAPADAAGVETSADEGVRDLVNAEPDAIVNFARYTEIRSAISRFQKAGDQQGYRSFLEELDQEERLVVPLRNLENKLQKNSFLDIETELRKLSGQLAMDAATLAGFRQAMLRFDRIQLLLNDFVQRVKKGPAPLMKAVQQIWGQVRLLLNQVEDAGQMKSQMKILLLGIQDPAVKKRTQEILESLLNRAHSIYNDR